MRPAFKVLATLALVAASAASVHAQVSLETVSGRTYEGEILSNDGTAVEIKTTDGATMKLPLEQLTPVSQYRLQREAAGDSAKGQLDLADWCVGKTLYEEAKNHYRKALAADALMADEINEHVVVARKTAAEELLARAKSLESSNQKQEARRILSLMVQELPLEEATKEATRLLAEDTTTRKKEALSSRSAKKADAPTKNPDGSEPALRANGEPFSEATRKLFQPMIDSYWKMLDSSQEGLTKGGSSGINEFERALKEGEKIRKGAEKLRPQGSADEEIAEALEIVDTKLEEAMVDVRINMANDYLLRTSYNQASEIVNAGLAEYPKNERLLQTRNQVSAAASNEGGGGWVFGGGRRG